MSSSPSAQFSAPIDNARVRTLFAHPPRVAESGFLRREIASRMFERLELVRLAPQRVIDAGCGEGGDLPLLQQRFAQAQLVGVDAAWPMLAAARAARAEALGSMKALLGKWLPARLAGTAGREAALVCADFAQLPFGAASADLLWSNLALHWHPQPDRVFAEWQRVLRVDGLLMFSCFGPDTFKEVRRAFAALDRDLHVLPFVDMHDFGDMLVQAGFATPVMDMETLTVTYDTPARLLADLRAWGGNPLASRRRGLYGRAAGQRFLDVLEQARRPDGKLGLTFEIVYGHAFRPPARRTAAGESIVRFDRPPK